MVRTSTIAAAICIIAGCLLCIEIKVLFLLRRADVSERNRPPSAITTADARRLCTQRILTMYEAPTAVNPASSEWFFQFRQRHARFHTVTRFQVDFQAVVAGFRICDGIHINAVDFVAALFVMYRCLCLFLDYRSSVSVSLSFVEAS